MRAAPAADDHAGAKWRTMFGYVRGPPLAVRPRHVALHRAGGDSGRDHDMMTDEYAVEHQASDVPGPLGPGPGSRHVGHRSPPPVGRCEVICQPGDPIAIERCTGIAGAHCCWAWALLASSSPWAAAWPRRPPSGSCGPRGPRRSRGPAARPLSPGVPGRRRRRRRSAPGPVPHQQRSGPGPSRSQQPRPRRHHPCRQTHNRPEHPPGRP
jgi:hypothetical protein